MTLPEFSSVVTSRKRSRDPIENDSSTVTQDEAFVPSVPLVQLALAGALTTFVADVMIHPMDCIKTLQQSDLGWELGLHNSLESAAQYLWNTSGLSGFYHGFLVYAGSDALAGAAKFATWEWWKRNMPSHILFWGAGIAFLSSSLFLVPGELVKQQLQMGLYPDFSAAVQGIAGTAGVEGFFVGYDATCYRDVPYTMLELGVYELLKKALDNEKKSTLREVGAASITGAIAAFLTTPMDTIKTKLMISDETYNYWDFAMNTLDSHGLEGLFSGMEARISWIVPFVCIYLPLYDNIKRFLIQRHEETKRP
jgi:solute carrier family 25 S-adenosylmethionine transporter 26